MGGSRAGQANEAGSVHRRGVAAYLAVYGLISRGLPAAGHHDQGPFPVRLEFETNQPTDDITCRLSDRSAMYVSAKRVCGDDRSLRSTVRQWVAQAATLKDGDLLVLAVAEPRGIVKDLGAALLRRQARSPTYLAGEDMALTVLGRLLAGEPEAVQDRVLNAARVLKVEAAEAGKPEFDLAAALLEGTVVGTGAGASSMRALSLSMHTQAGKAFSSGINDWIRVLREARIEIYADRRGPAGATAMARQVAVEEYRARLKDQDGHVNLALLADDLPPLRVAGLADDLQVSIDNGEDRPQDTSLLVLARRWPRLLLVGLPGAGKSTALRQLAARWAGDDRIPVPVLVSLGSAARRCSRPGELTLSVLCQIAAQEASTGLRVPLAEALEDMCRRGEATLLLDGLDECMNRRALIADDLSQIFGSLPPGTGVILATRSSGVSAARRLGLPAARLAKPSSLDSVLEQLLQHIAAVRIPEEDRNLWVGTRVKWLEQTRARYPDLGSVPLMAMLLALVAAESGDDQLPRSRASLLMTAVQASVHRWERQRADAEDRSDWPTSGRLLDGYAVLGHHLASAGEISTAEAGAAVSDMLADRWEPAQGAAEEAAQRILWFWDEHVGVFVSTDTGTLAPRSRVFTEIASAMWITKLPDQAITDWVAECLHDADRRVTLLLAAGLEPRVISALLTSGDPRDLEPSALLVVEAVKDGAGLRPDELTQLMHHLAAAASQGPRAPQTGAVVESGAAEPETAGTKRDGARWACARELALLKLPAGLRDGRRDLLNSLILSNEQRVVAWALCALSDAAAAGQPPPGDDDRAVRRALALPLPKKQKPVREESPRRVLRFSSGPSLLTGHAEVALAAAQQLGVLDDGLARRIHAIATRASYLTYPQVRAALGARGYRFPDPVRKKTIQNLQRSLAVWNSHVELPLLQAAARLSSDEIEMSRSDSWRLPGLRELFAALDAPHVGPPDFLAAVTADTDQMRRGWIHAACTAAGLSVTAIAAQARLAIIESSQADKTRHPILQLIITRPPGPTPATDPERLSRYDQTFLVGALNACSDWIADTSADMLFGIRDEHLRQQLLDTLPDLSAPRRRTAGLLACSAADHQIETAAELLSQADPAVRAGAARFLSFLSQPDANARKLLTDASTDNDLTIRLACLQRPGSTAPPATAWSCRACASYNNLTDADCQHCDRGTRPDTPGE